MTFNSALSGIQAATSELNVIGNNVANSSTTGFKSSSVLFSDVYASSALGTSSNAIGSGVRLSSVKQSFSQGNISFTNNNLDLSVSGQGFYRLNDSGSVVFSRAGSFGIDREGFIVNSSDQRLTGLLADNAGNITGAQGDLRVDAANIEPTSTSSVGVGFNVSSTTTPPAVAWVGSPNFGDPPPSPDTYNNVTSNTVYDSLGNSHIMSMYFIKTPTANQWDVRAQVDGVDVDAAPAAAPFTQVYNSDGSFNAASSEGISVNWAPLDASGNPNGATTPQSIAVTLSDSTQFGAPFSVQSMLQDGFTTGRLDSVDVGTNGLIFGRYTNGQSRPMGQLVLANFTNVNGLQALGDTSWGETFTSGPPLVGSPGSASLGVIQSGALEDSNVDLTNELVKMITTQRNFQANAQTIRTADQVTQTIINIR